MSSPVPALALPLTLGRVRLRNRFVSAPMERNYCEVDGTMTDRYVDYLVRRARGGAALVFTEASYVRADGKGRRRQMGVDIDARIPGIARLAAAVHAEGALLGVELNHGGRTAQSAVSGYVPVAPSAIPCAVAGGDLPQVLGTEEIHELVRCYADAAARCARAGVDVVSLHGGHGYLIHQFLSPAYNHRDDEFADPSRFLRLVVAAVRETAPELTLGLRFSAFEGIPDGLDAAATLELVSSLDTGSLDFLDVSAGNYEAGQWIIQPGEWERGVLAPYSRPYRDLGLPVGVAGRINTPEAAERIVASGQADFVSLARTLHADPDFPNRALRGERYRPCIACNFCIDNLGSGEPIPCTVNPWVGREAEEPTAALAAPVTVRVVGAGPTGLAAARDLARAGARVEVHDTRPRPGGDLALAAALQEYPEYGRLVEWHVAELGALGVPIHLGARVTPDVVAGWDGVDAVVLATGGCGPRLDLPGLGAREVLDVREWLATGRPPPSAVVVYGADREGAAVADDLAARGSAVTLVGPQPTVAADVGRRAKIVLVLRLLAHPRVRLHLDATLVGADGDRLRIRRGGSEGGTAEEWIDAPGPVLVSQGIEPRRDLLAACRALAPRLGVHPVGDAGGDGGSVHAANLTAVAAVRRITEGAGRALATGPAA
jgi:2,4-dienoyl-CoA reductase-like NADH-dependent reductase (Old Yellow Enzyme family)/thioredoxin reductase